MGATVSTRVRSQQEKLALADIRNSIPGGLVFSNGLILRTPSQSFSTVEQRGVLESCESTLQNAKLYVFNINEELGFNVDLPLYHTNTMSYNWPLEELEIENAVKQCWEKIEDQLDSCLCTKSARQQDDTMINWPVVRLFVSSTFRDFHAEREILVKKVFPELREWCTQHHLQFIECDLRWGVPRDSTTRTTICTCLDEIQRCHDETNGAGFFLNMLSERYGWVPDEEAVPCDLAEQYGWIHGTSVTHIEILRGAYTSKNPNALFLIRDPSFLQDLPDDQYSGFVDEAEYCKTHLKELKRKLKDRFSEQVFDYSCQIDKVENGKVKMTGLDVFAQTVLKFYKTTIAQQYPKKDIKDQTPDDIEKEQHHIFMEQRGGLVFGRDKMITRMVEFATTSTDGDSPMVIVGDPGQGKSALMAKCVKEAKQAGLNVFYHFVGCSRQSTDASNLVYRLCEALVRSENEEWIKLKKEFNYNQSLKLLSNLLEEFGKTEEQLLVIIDAVNQLVPVENYLKWMPSKMCFGSLRLIISTTREGNVLETINDMLPSMCQLNLTELDESAKMDMAQNYFARYNKRLDPEQLSLLIQSEGSKNVLWLSLVCEELRIFGVFEEVTERIKRLPPSLEGLISEIIERMVHEDETTFVEKILCLLECSQSGLKETELHVMLGDCESNMPVAMLPWAQARRTLMPFLRNSGRAGEEQSLDFFHASIKKAVRKGLLSSLDKQKVYHLRLAEYFQYHCDDVRRVINELPHQLKAAGKSKRLVDFVTTDTRSRNLGQFMVSRLLQEFRCQSRFCSPGPFTKTIQICVFCQNFKGGIVKLALWPNKDVCYLCGQRIPSFHRKTENEAMMCSRHTHMSTRSQCCVCKRHLMMQQGTRTNGLPMYLCQMCSGGGNKGRCTKIVTDEEGN